MQDLQQLRSTLNNLDSQIVQLLAQRSEVCHDVGRFKLKHNLPVVDEKREQQLVDRLMQLAVKQNLSTQLIQEIYGIVLQHSRSIQQKLGAR